MKVHLEMTSNRVVSDVRGSVTYITADFNQIEFSNKCHTEISD
jgi:hypothetical protein